MQSMTGYGKETSRQGDWEMTVELRAVNHRFLDLSMRLGRGLTFLEETIRKTLAPLCRGHVDVQLTLRRISGSDSDVTVDETLAAAYMQAANTLHAAAALREQIASRAPQVVEEYRLRLTERLARLPIEPVDPARLAQEVALMADKCAIDEELSRLESHIAQMHVYLDVSGETGKKMDFLIQEMNREANTIGSKCSDAQMAQNVVNLKSEIEKMREQIQNAV